MGFRHICTLVMACALGIGVTAAHASDRVEDRTDVPFEACLRHCRKVSVYDASLDSCERTCAAARRDSSYGKGGYSSYESCVKDMRKVELKRDLLIADGQEECQDASPHLHKRYGCREAVSAYYSALTAGNMCVSYAKPAQPYPGTAQPYAEPAPVSVPQGAGSTGPAASGTAAPGLVPLPMGATAGTRERAQAASLPPQDAVDTPKYQSPEEVAKTRRKGKGGAASSARAAPEKKASSKKAASTGASPAKAAPAKEPAAKAPAAASGKKKTGGGAKAGVSLPSGTKPAGEKDAPMPEPSSALPGGASASQAGPVSPPASVAGQAPASAVPAAPVTGAPVVRPTAEPQAPAAPTLQAAPISAVPAVRQPSAPGVPEQVAPPPSAPHDPYAPADSATPAVPQTPAVAPQDPAAAQDGVLPPLHSPAPASAPGAEEALPPSAAELAPSLSSEKLAPPLSTEEAVPSPAVNAGAPAPSPSALPPDAPLSGSVIPPAPSMLKRSETVPPTLRMGKEVK